jgi:aspartate-semialdehyde dehydrogenase
MNRIPVAVLGATGAVGQRLVSLLGSHPWSELAGLCASERSVGRPYLEAARWLLPEEPPAFAREAAVLPCEPDSRWPLVFSALDAEAASTIEEDFARAGALVVSNARSHRMRADVPLVVPEVNPGHLALARNQSYGRGAILTNPNCSSIGLVLALAPLERAFGIETVRVTTLQAASGAGYPGVSSLDLIDNVIPFISGEEEKLETEPLKILGELREGRVEKAAFGISATATRVPVIDGHTLVVSLRLRAKPSRGEVLDAWSAWRGGIAELGLPSAPRNPLLYREEKDRPQPRLDRQGGAGMATTIGRLRACPLDDWKFVALSHNTIRGAAGGTILLAELAVAKGLLDSERKPHFVA